ncbi:MAG TPA: DOMON-like domain-containing protein [Bdellovibrionota bacterium]|nr:DOMON-like domain-containing protein [Bdellovibrionota bacterium]
MDLSVGGEWRELLPFEEGETGFRVHAKAERRGSLITIEYRVGGENAGRILMPPVSASPARKDGLWNSTCLEAFLAEAGQPWYWELNLSPSLDWQAYHFRDYRQGSKPEPRVQRLKAERLAENSAGAGFLLTLDASPLFVPKATLDVGITAVIEDVDGKKGYWALSHAGNKADFHVRRSFSLAL